MSSAQNTKDVKQQASHAILIELEKIMKKLEDFQKEFNEYKSEDKVVKTEIIVKEDTILSAVQNTKSTSRSTGTKTTSANTAVGERKFPLNCMYWLKAMWRSEPDEVIRRFFDDDVKESIEKHMQSTEELREKVDEAKKIEEFKYLWQTYVHKNSVNTNKITNAYKKAKEEYESKSSVAKADEEGENGHTS